MLGHMKSFLKKKKNCQGVFHCGYLTFYSCQQKMRCRLKQNKKGVVSPHPYQHVVLSVFWILSILTGVGSSALICSFPVTHAVGVFSYLFAISVLGFFGQGVGCMVERGPTFISSMNLRISLPPISLKFYEIKSFV